ncbi:MAG: amidohydrolase family protein [Xanthomonadales bacterium]|nr:amidohydrolase family protein [Xanthomonadales bacterium]
MSKQARPRFQNDPDGERLPVKLDATTNGEYLPRPLAEHTLKTIRMASEQAGDNARRLGQGRREFLVSLSGAATCLLAMNKAAAAVGQTGGLFELPDEAAFEVAAADESIGKKEFIFDIQTHHFNPPDSWSNTTPWSEAIRQTAANTGCNVLPDEEFGYMSCSDARAFVREIFLDSDTDAGVLTYVPTSEEKMPLSHAEAQATQQIVNAMPGGQRLLLHGRVIPNLPGDLERMDELQAQFDVAGWKTYTQYGETHDSGWWLNDDGHGRAFLEKVRASGVKTISCHKGLPLPFPMMGEGNLDYRFCHDVGPAAKEFSDIDFIIFHSGYDPDMAEGPFEPGKPKSGTDSLVQSVLDSELGTGSNVYAELGSTWQMVMREPDQAAHLIGKLLKYLGEDNVLWGTDCLFYGSPQDQIQAFRSFQISDEFQDRFGYPRISDAVRAKVFGLSAARIYGIEPERATRAAQADAVGRARAQYLAEADPTFRSYGPKTRREFFQLAKAGH